MLLRVVKWCLIVIVSITITAGNTRAEGGGSMEMSDERVVEKSMRSKLTEKLKPTFLDMINESTLHFAPEGAESHFKLIIVSESFVGKTLLERHRMINAIIAKELEENVHALSITAKTPSEWEAQSDGSLS